MKKWESVDETLDFAIENEQKAVDFYTKMAEKAKDAALKHIFEDFKKEEEGHKAKLIGVKKGGRMVGSTKKVLDLKIEDYLVDVDEDQDRNYQQALALAMKREKAAFKLYTDLADSVEDVEIKSLFRVLAQEEAKHKLRFEIEYDDQILQQN